MWNGAGGKTNDKETLEKAAVRETKEEIGVIPKRLSRVATLHFFFPDDPQKLDWNQDVYVFVTKSWSGIPQESEEMNPRWFDFNEIPYHTMWADDAVWLPKVLKGFKVEGWFLFDEENRMVDYKLKVLK